MPPAEEESLLKAWAWLKRLFCNPAAAEEAPWQEGEDEEKEEEGGNSELSLDSTFWMIAKSSSVSAAFNAHPTRHAMVSHDQGEDRRPP